MFSSGKHSKGGKAATYADKVSIIAGGMTLTGDVESEGDVRVDGTIRGNIYCKSKVVVIASGKVEGDIVAVNVDVHGAVHGNITVQDLLSLKSSSSITGNLTTDKLQIEPNAVFNGHCKMGAGAPVMQTVVTEEGMMVTE